MPTDSVSHLLKNKWGGFKCAKTWRVILRLLNADGWFRGSPPPEASPPPPKKHDAIPPRPAPPQGLYLS